MKRHVVAAILCGLSVLTLAGCGGSGGSSGPAATTKAVTKVYLFGNITSAGKIVATVKTTMNVPVGAMVNYSSTPGATSGLCNLRKGVIVPSGAVQVPASDFDSSTYDIASRILTVNLVNFPGQNQAALRSGASGNGAEFATINFTLATPGTTLSSLPEKDDLAEVGQDVLATHDLSYPPGSKVNFVTTYQ